MNLETPRLTLVPTPLHVVRRRLAEASFTDTWEAVGMVGFKGDPDADGAVELGYGINPSFWNRGFATEIVGALVAYARQHEQVRLVKAETSISNTASRRVLEKNGFVATGRREDPDDGLLDLWVLAD